MSAAKDPEPEGLTVAEENAERLETQTAELPPRFFSLSRQGVGQASGKTYDEKVRGSPEGCLQKHPIN